MAMGVGLSMGMRARMPACVRARTLAEAGGSHPYKCTYRCAYVHAHVHVQHRCRCMAVHRRAKGIHDVSARWCNALDSAAEGCTLVVLMLGLAARRLEVAHMGLPKEGWWPSTAHRM